MAVFMDFALRRSPHLIQCKPRRVGRSPAEVIERQRSGRGAARVLALGPCLCSCLCVFPPGCGGRDDCSRIKVGDPAELLRDAIAVAHDNPSGESVVYAYEADRPVGPYDDLLCCTRNPACDTDLVSCPCGDICDGIAASATALWELDPDLWGKPCHRRTAVTQCVVWVRDSTVVARGEFCRNAG